MQKKRCTAILLAAGSGSRMKSTVAKQYMLLDGKPLIWYALQAIQDSDIIDDCILVTGAEDIEFVQKEILEKYGFYKVKTVTAGGAERYLSVGNALQVIADGGMEEPNQDGYVFIHDGARPFLTEEILCKTYEAVQKYHACVAAMPVKDTVKIVDEEEFAVTTPERKRVWSIQTPQVFDTQLVLQAYRSLQEHQKEMDSKGVMVTDDASVVELFTEQRVKMVEGSYENIKITTPEDINVAESFLKKSRKSANN